MGQASDIRKPQEIPDGSPILIPLLSQCLSHDPLMNFSQQISDLQGKKIDSGSLNPWVNPLSPILP